MEMSRFPGRVWVVSHKPVAIAAGLGRMGIHRNVIHPRFGSFILLGTVILDVELDRYDSPVDFNPCLSCKLCVAACPTGAIGAGGEFNFSACYTHNYREFMGGFTDWVESIADSADAARLLLERGAPVDAVSADGETALGFAEGLGNERVAEVIAAAAERTFGQAIDVAGQFAIAAHRQPDRFEHDWRFGSVPVGVSVARDGSVYWSQYRTGSVHRVDAEGKIVSLKAYWDYAATMKSAP